MKNIDIRNEIEKSNVYQWQIADELNISEFTLCRKLRHELTNQEKANILSVIEKLKEEKK